MQDFSGIVVLPPVPSFDRDFSLKDKLHSGVCVALNYTQIEGRNVN